MKVPLIWLYFIFADFPVICQLFHAVMRISVILNAGTPTHSNSLVTRPVVPV